MYMAGHEHVGVDGQIIFVAGALKAIQKEQEIRLGTEYPLPIMTALDDVEGNSSGKEAGQTGHQSTCTVWKSATQKSSR